MLGRWLAERPVGDLLDATAPHLGRAGATLFRDPARRRNAVGEPVPVFTRYLALVLRFGPRIDQLLTDRAERILMGRGQRPLYATIWRDEGSAPRSLYAAARANRSSGVKKGTVNGAIPRPIRTEAAPSGPPVPLSWRCCGRLNTAASRCGCVAPWESGNG